MDTFAPHAELVDAVIAKLGSHATEGLSDARAADLRREHGPNRIPDPPSKPWYRRLLAQLASPLVLTLLGAAAITVVVGAVSGSAEGPLARFGDAIAILLIVALNAGIGLAQEERAASALDSLRRLAVPNARVIRGGRAALIAADDIVPGDVVEVEAGDAVPADARLIDARDLRLDEASLTGESTGVTKDAAARVAIGAPVAERANMLFQGTTVVRGRARAVIVATGGQTELGRIGGLIAGHEHDPTPLEALLDTFGRRVLVACVAVSVVLFAWGMLRPQVLSIASLRPWHVLLLEAVSFAVAAIPEGLPAITTITLALGTQRLAKLGAIVRKLPAVETLGAATVICSDKTGTLTQNRIVVREVLVAGAALGVTGEGYAPGGTISGDGGAPPDEAVGTVLSELLRTAVLCNDAALERTAEGEWRVIGDPTEGALLTLASRGGVSVDELRAGTKRAREIAFDGDRKRMTVIVTAANGSKAYVKGSLEVLLPRCRAIATAHGEQILDDAERGRISAQADAMASRALRVLAICQGTNVDADPESELTLLGLVGMMDPPRAGVLEAVAACRTAGVRVVMITGDHRLTAMTIAQEIGMWTNGDEAITGDELARIDDAELARRVNVLRVFARTSPEQKLRIVRAFKQRGHIVAMTGDGVNDAPALAEAHIGIAMGRSGTDVARQASALVLADDNFATIVAAIREGRAIYRNIQKFVFFLLSSNAGLAVAVFAISMSGSWLPLTPLMILWINLVTNGLPALALGVDPADPSLMNEPPRRPSEPFFGAREGWGLAFVGAVMGFGAIAMYAWTYCEHATGPQGPRTLAFTVLALSPLLHAWSCRSPSASLFAARPLVSRPLLGAVVLSGAVQLVAILIPWLRPVFRTDGLTAHDWMMVAIASVAVVIAVEIAKWMARRITPAQSGLGTREKVGAESLV